MNNPHYDRQLRAMLTILSHDYAGLALTDAPVDSRYYVQAAGMAWKEGTLDALTFLRFGSQMLATTMDRSLRLALTAEGYAPWRAGFDARRFGDSLCVTAVQEETRLRPGDRIIRLNALSPAAHRAQFQKNFLYAREPEREMWGNVLKMTAHIGVLHADGTQEDLPLRRFFGPRPACPPQLLSPAPGIVCLRVGDVGDGAALEALVTRDRAQLDGARRLILDLRATHDGEESAFLPLMPYVFKSAKTMSEAAGMQTLCTLYTEENCRRRAALLSPYAGDPTADALLASLEEKRGALWVGETFDLWEDVPQAIQPRGGETLLLTDTFCEGAAEAFALLARREGRAALLGRPTMGNLDTASPIRVALSDELVFTYPMSITAQARRGEGFMGRGVAPDTLIPFTPEECTRDVILERALS